MKVLPILAERVAAKDALDKLKKEDKVDKSSKDEKESTPSCIVEIEHVHEGVANYWLQMCGKTKSYHHFD
jgi:hypothetical protein